MTKNEMMEAKRMAKRAAETAGEMKNVVMSKMTLLETSTDEEGNVGYVMFEYEGHQYQAWEDAAAGTRHFEEYVTSDGEIIVNEYPTLTEMEEAVMREIPQDNFYESGFDSVIWSDVFCEESSIDGKKIRGVISSLAKKGMLFVDGKGREVTISLTKMGQKYLLDNGICDADGWYIPAAKTVTLLAFTGMVIGEFKIKSETSTTITIETKQGDMLIDKATKLQLDPKNKKFANRIA